MGYTIAPIRTDVFLSDMMVYEPEKVGSYMQILLAMWNTGRPYLVNHAKVKRWAKKALPDLSDFLMIEENYVEIVPSPSSISLLDAKANSALARAQMSYSRGQIDLAINSPHFAWTNGPRRPLKKSIRMEIYERDNGICAYCDTNLPPDGFSVDHIHPVALGGSDDLDNLTVACRSCNSAKGVKTLEDRSNG